MITSVYSFLFNNIHNLYIKAQCSNLSSPVSLVQETQFLCGDVNLLLQNILVKQFALIVFYINVSSHNSKYK